MALRAEKIYAFFDGLYTVMLCIAFPPFLIGMIIMKLIGGVQDSFDEHRAVQIEKQRRARGGERE
jgi:hypothetical protein